MHLVKKYFLLELIVFFVCVASTDLLFNLSLVSRCIIDLTLSMSIYFCQLLAFVSHLAELLSACFTVHFTVQRFTAVRFPLSVFIEKNIHLLHYCIVSLFVITGVTYCYMLVKLNGYDDCQEDLGLGWFLSDALSSFVIPFIIIATLNFLIIFHLRKTCRDKEQLSFTKRPKTGYAALNPRKKYSISYDSSSHSKYSDHSSGLNMKVIIYPRKSTSLYVYVHVAFIFLVSLQASMYQVSSSTETNDHFLSVGNIRSRTASIRSTTRYHAQSHRVTRMLILVSTCFLLLNAPSHICSISLELYTLRKSATRTINNSSVIPMDYFNHSNETKFENSSVSRGILPRRQVTFLQIFYIILIISKHIAYLSYSINFFLYSFCGMKFRGELMKFLTRYRKYRRQIKRTPIIIQENSF